MTPSVSDVVNWMNAGRLRLAPKPYAAGIGGNMPKKPDKPKAKCKNCEGKGLVKHGDKKVRCQRCAGTGFKS
jgi:hypothetical protein